MVKRKQGCVMKVEMVDGVKVIKLQDSTMPGESSKAEEMLTVAYLWQLLSGGHALKDGTVFERHVL
jgi:hypothetical protein